MHLFLEPHLKQLAISKKTLLPKLKLCWNKQEITTELDALIDAVESHSPVFRKKATELEALLAHYKTLL